jgi:hypothetical protein
MLDKTRTKCGLNGRNSDFVRNDGFVTPLKIRACGQRISSTSCLKRYFVRKIDGVSFGELSSDRIIRFGRYDILKIFNVLKKFIVKFCTKQRQL